MGTKIDLDELERLAKAATPGPWTQRGNFIFCAQNKRLAYVEAERTLDLQTASYIVASGNALPELIKMYRKAKDEANDADTAYQMVDRDNVDLTRHILELRAKVAELERQRDWLAEFISNAFAGITPAKQFIEWAEEAAKEAGE